MTLFCNCNAAWEDELGWLEDRHQEDNSDKVCRLILTESHESSGGERDFGYCMKCNMFMWYDADYETLHLATLVHL